MTLAKEERWSKIDIESDCKFIIDRLQRKWLNNSIIGTILEDIAKLRMLFRLCGFPLPVELEMIVVIEMQNLQLDSLKMFNGNLISLWRLERSSTK